MQVCMHVRRREVDGKGRREGRACEEEENAVAHGAEHGGEALADDEGEEHVGGHVDASASSARLQGLDLPAQSQARIHILPEQDVCTNLHH